MDIEYIIDALSEVKSMTDITNEEWLAHSEDWRKGYNAWAHDEKIDDQEEHNSEWMDGYRYAMRTVGVG